MLTVRDLFCERDDRVLFEGLSFSLEAGQAMQIQGSNGSGKTTLLRVLCGLNQDFRGELFWQGVPIRDQAEAFRQAMFYLGHTPAINKSLTPAENLDWFCALRGVRAKVPVSEALAAFSLFGYEDIPCSQLSAGQQRRVSLARMKLIDAPIWMLDEPFTALDRQAVSDLETFLSQHVNAGGTVILSTHHPLQLSHQVREINLDTLAGLAGSADKGSHTDV